MNTENFEKLKNILLGSNLHGTEVNEVSDLIDRVSEEYHQDKLKSLVSSSSVRISLQDFPENLPLYKDSGLWQLREDDMEEVIFQQEVNESDLEFIERCKAINEF